jgi:biopolymer transport protein ExbB/TolQ
MWTEVARSFQLGNGYILSMLIIGFIALVIFFERVIMIQGVYNINFSKFLNNLRKMVLAEDLNRAISLCRNTSSTSLPKIACKALEAADSDPTRVRGTIEEEALDFLPAIERRIGALPALTLMIMLIGILGTIDSLWIAFQSVDVLDTAKKQATIAQGIASSLSPTALGLLFGTLMLAGYYFLKGIALNLTEEMHHGVAVLFNLLAPRDTVSYVSIPDSNESPSNHSPTHATAAPIEQRPNTNQAAPANKPEENFDDASIEDIKDEEEII